MRVYISQWAERPDLVGRCAVIEDWVTERMQFAVRVGDGIEYASPRHLACAQRLHSYAPFAPTALRARVPDVRNFTSAFEQLETSGQAGRTAVRMLEVAARTGSICYVHRTARNTTATICLATFLELEDRVFNWLALCNGECEHGDDEALGLVVDTLNRMKKTERCRAAMTRLAVRFRPRFCMHDDLP